MTRCKNRKDAKVVFAYGNTKPLPTFGTFTVLVMCTDTSVTVEADFVVMVEIAGFYYVETQRKN